MDMLISQLVIGCFMIGLTVLIHAIILDKLVDILEKAGPLSYQKFRKFWEVPMMIGAVLGVFLAHVIQIWLWALLFLYLVPETLPDLESALYFSASSFTTVGFGDVYLDKEWRLLSAFEAANGFILFGWSTAFIFEVIIKIYKERKIKKT
jgi:hypothetical protein